MAMLNYQRVWSTPTHSFNIGKLDEQKKSRSPSSSQHQHTLAADPLIPLDPEVELRRWKKNPQELLGEWEEYYGGEPKRLW